MTPVVDRYGRVAVLLGGKSGEREVSLDSGRAVAKALQQAGLDVVPFDPAERALHELQAEGVTRVWNALHGGDGEDGTIQGALAILGIPVTGSGVMASALAMDKVRSKAVMAAHGVRVVGGRVLRRGAALPVDLDYPVFVKPSNGGSSLGALPVADADALADAVAVAHALDDTVLIEPLLPGPEYTVGVLDQRALPPIRIDAGNEFYDHAAKYTSEETRFVCPAVAADSELGQRFAAQSLAAFNALGCRGWGRVDFMMDGEGVPCVLEVNTVPGMTSHSLVPHAAGVAGIDFQSLCLAILDTSFAGEVH
ncbi:MAG: D-alanine--D-alanine ligase [Pseudomonadota bacterium]